MKGDGPRVSGARSKASVAVTRVVLMDSAVCKDGTSKGRGVFVNLSRKQDGSSGDGARA